MGGGSNRSKQTYNNSTRNEIAMPAQKDHEPSPAEASNQPKAYAGHEGVPLTPSQLVFHDNVVATKQMPDAMARRLAQRRLYLSSTDAKADLSAYLKPHAGETGLWELDLPAKSVVGLPGRSAERMDPKSIPKNLAGKKHLDAFRPPWADHVFHPKLSSAPDAPQNVLRTLKGTRFRPTYGAASAPSRTNVPLMTCNSC